MIGILAQARSGSKRYPRKIYEDINGKMTLYRVLESCKNVEMANKIILLIPEIDKHEFGARFADGQFDGAVDDRFGVYFGSENDVLDRYFKAARQYGIDLIIRITCDTPLIQSFTITEMVTEYLKNGYNGFMGNNELVSSNWYSSGFDCEIFPYWMLAEAHRLAKEPAEREHVSPYMYSQNKPYNIYEFKNQRPNTRISTRFPDVSFDTKEDYELIKKIAKIYDECGDINKAIEGVEL